MRITNYVEKDENLNEKINKLNSFQHLQKLVPTLSANLIIAVKVSLFFKVENMMIFSFKWKTQLFPPESLLTVLQSVMATPPCTTPK